MLLKPPFEISSRLLPAVQVGGDTISLEYLGRTADARQRWRYYIDLPDGQEFSDDDLQSGCGSCDGPQEVMESLLSFLGACAESVQCGTRTGEPGENADLFPPAVGAWAAQNSDEIALLQCDLEEIPGLVTM